MLIWKRWRGPTFDMPPLRFAVSPAGVITPSVQCPVVTDGKLCDGHEGPPSLLGEYP